MKMTANEVGSGTVNLSYQPNESGTGFEKYYKINDHLGSVRAIMRQDGFITSEYDYKLFGEKLESKGNDRLSFINKEKDAESSLSDFGVRKYDEEIGRFTSIDPLFEKYYSLTPYQYSANNPVNAKDDGGMLINWLTEKKYSEEMWDRAVKYLEDNGATEEAEKLKFLKSSPDFTLNVSVMEDGAGWGDNGYNSRTKTIYWNPTQAFKASNGVLTPAETLFHEGNHAYSDLFNWFTHILFIARKNNEDKEWKNNEEKKLGEDEYKLAKKLGHVKNKKLRYVRINYFEKKGKFYKVKGPDTLEKGK